MLQCTWTGIRHNGEEKLVDGLFAERWERRDYESNGRAPETADRYESDAGGVVEPDHY